MASPSPTEADFAEFRTWLRQRPDVLTIDTMALIEARFPKDSDCSRYIHWAAAESTPSMLAALKERYECPTTQQLIDCIHTTPYNDPSRHIQLVKYLEGELVPFILIGKDDDTVYRLAPAAYVLQAHKPPNWKDGRGEILPHSVLGVNLNVEACGPGRLRYTILPGESTNSTEPYELATASTAPGFVFHQLGSLQYYAGDEWDDSFSEKQMLEAPWLSTRFCVVVRIDPTTGAGGEIWVIYNFFPYNAIDNREHISHEEWGFLPEEDEVRENQFSCAKIANSITELGPGKHIKFEQRITHEPELVRVLFSNNRLVRQTTAEELG